MTLPSFRHTIVLVLTTRLSLELISASGFTAPDWSEDANAATSRWQSFSTSFGEPGNTPDQAGSHAGPVLTQSTPGAIITGSGNIYNPAGTSAFTIADQTAARYQTISLQTKMTGAIDPQTVSLNFETAGGAVALSTDMIELSRESGGFGDTVINQWIWDLSDYQVSRVSLEFEATGTHSSLDALRLDTLVREQGAGELIEANFHEPSQDRWNYLFNVTPGTRPRASVFRSVDPEIGVKRHGVFAFTYDTSSIFPPGKDERAYEIVSASVRVMTSDNFDVPYDPSLDAVTSYLPPSADDFANDQDPGRPIELFGAGLRHDLSFETWVEGAPYIPEGETDRSLFPAVLDDSGELVDITLAVDYTNPLETPAFAIGTLNETPPGAPIPADSWMEFEFDLSQKRVVNYLQRSLAKGTLAFTLTSLNGGGQENRAFPEFYTRDSLLGEAPQLSLSVRVIEPSREPEPPVIKGIESTDDGIKIRFTADDSSKLKIRWSSDFSSWIDVVDPSIISHENGSFSWTDTDLDSDAKVYQLLQQP